MNLHTVAHMTFLQMALTYGSGHEFVFTITLFVNDNFVIYEKKMKMSLLSCTGCSYTFKKNEMILYLL